MLLELWFEQQTKTVKALKLRKLCLLMSEHERKISFLVLRKKVEIPGLFLLAADMYYGES